MRLLHKSSHININLVLLFLVWVYYQRFEAKAVVFMLFIHVQLHTELNILVIHKTETQWTVSELHRHCSEIDLYLIISCLYIRVSVQRLSPFSGQWLSQNHKVQEKLI